MLSYIKTKICWDLHFGEVADSKERDKFSWQYFLDINLSYFPSISIDTIRDNLYVIVFDTTTWKGILRQKKYFFLKFLIRDASKKGKS